MPSCACDPERRVCPAAYTLIAKIPGRVKIVDVPPVCERACREQEGHDVETREDVVTVKDKARIVFATGLECGIGCVFVTLLSYGNQELSPEMQLHACHAITIVSRPREEDGRGHVNKLAIP